MNQVLSAIHDRHSTRAFTAQQVSRADLETILEAGLWAPTGMGKQLWHFSAIRNAEKCLELACAVADADNRGPAYNFYGAPCHIIVSYKRDEIHAFPDGSAAIQTMLLAAQSLGISSCWINQLRPLTDHASIRPLLTRYGVPEDHIVIGSIALGYADESVAAAPHKRKTDVITITE